MFFKLSNINKNLNFVAKKMGVKKSFCFSCTAAYSTPAGRRMAAAPRQRACHGTSEMESQDVDCKRVSVVSLMSASPGTSTLGDRVAWVREGARLPHFRSCPLPPVSRPAIPSHVAPLLPQSHRCKTLQYDFENALGDYKGSSGD